MKSDDAYVSQIGLLQMQPLNGSRWVHYKGGIYKVLMKAVESNEPHRVIVLYESEDMGFLWSHSIDEWEKVMELKDGTLVKRFTPYYDTLDILENQWD